MMKCKHCGAPIHEGETSCAYCGTMFEHISLRNTQPESHQPMTVELCKQEKPAEKRVEVHERVVYVEKPVSVPAVSDKRRIISLILCLLLGIFGVHKFYERRYGMGIIYLLTMGFFGMGILVDMLVLLLGKPRDGKGLTMPW
ncbi:MAG: TM2 domain-containing protein [Aristaeellaceae bacterium]